MGPKYRAWSKSWSLCSGSEYEDRDQQMGDLMPAIVLCYEEKSNRVKRKGMIKNNRGRDFSGALDEQRKIIT